MSDLLPAEAFWDHLQVIIGSTEHLKFMEFTNARGNAFKVKLVAIDKQTPQESHLTDRSLKYTNYKMYHHV
jgi:hypothetical protein